MSKKILSMTLAVIMCMSCVISSLAAPTPSDGLLDATGEYANSTGSVAADKNAVDIDGVVGKDTTQGKYSQYEVIYDGDTRTEFDPEISQAEVYATKQSVFTLRIPKTIVLSSAGAGSFAVSVKGDITGAQTINVKPEANTFEMGEVIPGTGTSVAAGKAKPNITATITMTDQDWTFASDFKALPVATRTTTYTDHEGSISAPDISAGSWAGTFDFSINMNVEIPAIMKVTNYSSMKIAENEHLFAIGATQPEYVVAEFNDDYTEVIITKNGEDSDGIMARWTLDNHSPMLMNGGHNLKTVTISNGVVNIGTCAFESCDGITDVYIADSVETIEESAFCWCYNLTNIKWPKNLKSIKDSAFSNCDSLKEIVLPDGVLEAGRAFYPNQPVETLYYPSSMAATMGTEVSDMYSTPGTPDTLKRVSVPFTGMRIFKNHTALEFAEVLSPATKVPSEMFSGCTNLKTVSISATVTSIASDAFKDVPKSCVIKCCKRSYAESWAKANGFVVDATKEPATQEERDIVDANAIMLANSIKDNVVLYVNNYSISYYAALYLCITDGSEEAVAQAQNGDLYIKEYVDTNYGPGFAEETGNPSIDTLDEYLVYTCGKNATQMSHYIEFGTWQ